MHARLTPGEDTTYTQVHACRGGYLTKGHNTSYMYITAPNIFFQSEFQSISVLHTLLQHSTHLDPVCR